MDNETRALWMVISAHVDAPTQCQLAPLCKTIHALVCQRTAILVRSRWIGEGKRCLSERIARNHCNGIPDQPFAAPSCGVRNCLLLEPHPMCLHGVYVESYVFMPGTLADKMQELGLTICVWHDYILHQVALMCPLAELGDLYRAFEHGYRLCADRLEVHIDHPIYPVCLEETEPWRPKDLGMPHDAKELIRALEQPSVAKKLIYQPELLRALRLQFLPDEASSRDTKRQRVSK